MALTLALVSPVVINRFDDYFREQETQNLLVRRVATFAVHRAAPSMRRPAGEAIPSSCPMVAAVGSLNPRVRDLFASDFLAGSRDVAQADISIEVGALGPGVDGTPNGELLPVPDGQFVVGQHRGSARPGWRVIRPSRSGHSSSASKGGVTSARLRASSVELRQPYTRRASTVGAMTGLLMVIALIAFGIAVIVAAILSRRFTSPLRRLTDASRRIAEGDLASRVSPEAVGAGTLELSELAAQFNTMADRLEESVAIIRRDRDRSRDFLADVSHELRTPIAALRTFTELLQGKAGEKPETRAEFLESSAIQLERLDWLAQNLLELSKLDSGLVLLDLRPDDVRATVESAVEQAEPTARKRGVAPRAATARAPAADPPRSAARGPDRDEPRGQRAEVHRARRPGSRRRPRRRRTGRRGSR